MLYKYLIDATNLSEENQKKVKQMVNTSFISDNVFGKPHIYEAFWDESINPVELMPSGCTIKRIT